VKLHITSIRPSPALCAVGFDGGAVSGLVLGVQPRGSCPKLHIIAMLLVPDRHRREQVMTIQGPLRSEVVLAAFEEHLRRTRGVCPEVRHNYGRYAQAFLDEVFGEELVDPTNIRAREIIEFVSAMTARYRPATVQLVATSLRSFLRFLRAEGLCDGRIEGAVPRVPSRRLTSVPRHLDSEEFTRLIASLEDSSPRALRDKAILLCVARVGLRASEVARLRLEHLNWRNGTVRIETRKNGHGVTLPLPDDLGRALVAYLQRGRPATQVRQVFVLHHMHVGAPINRQIVGDAVCRALRHAGISAPMRGANLLRHSLATDLLAHEATLKEIADLFGHASLVTTGIYAKVNIAALREVALPWPGVNR
jgi:integrase/recombinase XerD